MVTPASRIEPVSDASDRAALLGHLKEYLSRVEPERVEARRSAETAARALIQGKLGRFEAEDVRRLYELFNQDWANGGPRKTRFSPAFSKGIHLRDALQVLGAFNRWMTRLWEAGPDEVPSVLDEFWAAREIPGAGRSLPTMVLYLKDPVACNVFMGSTAKGASRIAGKPLRGRSGAVYQEFNEVVRGLREQVEIPTELMDLALWWLSSEGSADQVQEVVPETERVFEGFSRDAFTYLEELSKNNNRPWYHANKERRKE